MNSEMKISSNSDRSDKSNVYNNATVGYVYSSLSGKSNSIGNAGSLETESRMTATEEWRTMVVSASSKDANSISESRTRTDRIGSRKNSVMSNSSLSNIMKKRVDAAVRSSTTKSSLEYSDIGNNGSSSPAGKINDPNPAAESKNIMSNMVGSNSIMVRDGYNASNRYKEWSARPMAGSWDAATNSTYKALNWSKSGSANTAV